MRPTFLSLLVLLGASTCLLAPASGHAQQGIPTYREPGPRQAMTSLPSLKRQLAAASERNSKAGMRQRAQLVAAGLKQAPNDPDILYYAAWLAIDQELYGKANELLAKLPPAELANPRVQKLQRVVTEHKAINKADLSADWVDKVEPSKIYKNFMQVETYPAFASDRQHPWFYNDYTYGRITDHGSFYASVNQAMRNNITGYQYVASGYPKVNDYLYFFAEYGYSDSSLYPQDKATLRANVVLPEGVEIGPGAQYYLIQRQELWSYTVWLSKTFGNNWFAVKPLFFKRANQDAVLYMVLNYRYYFDDPNRFIALAFGTGKAPDLLDLNASGLIIVDQTDYFVSYHFAVKDNVFLYFGGGYVRQLYPTGLLRKIPTMLYGLNFYF